VDNTRVLSGHIPVEHAKTLQKSTNMNGKGLAAQHEQGSVMSLTRAFKPAALLAAITLAATPAVAQEREHSRGRAEGVAVQRDRSNETRRAPRAEAPRSTQPAQAESRRAEASRAESRADSRAAIQSRGDSHSPVYQRQEYGGAVPRPQVVAPRVDGPVVVVPRVVRPVIVAPRVYAPRYYYGGYYGYRPGFRPYVFRPWTRLSFGFFVGYPVPYVYSYAYPVPVYGYGAPAAPVYITPSSTLYGGVAFDISPADAEVFVDGQFVGQVRDFDGVGAPLNLTVGRHRVDVSAPGYEPLWFDVDVRPGQLVPYHGDMRPIQ
jgi:PEGA domain